MEIFNDGNMWVLYLSLFIGPFVQEDTAVITAASFSVSYSEHWISFFTVVLAGLILSDSWKYWLGWAAKHHQWAKRFAKKDKVISLQNTILSHSMKTLIAVRFLPFARIPAYLAAGFFGVSYFKHWISIAFSGFLYVILIFCALHLLGEIVDEKIKTYMPLIGLGLLSIVAGIVFATQKIKSTSSKISRKL